MVGRIWCWASVWVRAGAGVDVGVGLAGDWWLLRYGFPVCVSALRHLLAFGLWGAGPAGAGGGWLAAVVAWCLRGRSRILGSALVLWPDTDVSVGVFMAWAVWVMGTPLLGAGRLVGRGWLVWVDWGGVSGMCAPKAW